MPKADPDPDPQQWWVAVSEDWVKRVKNGSTAPHKDFDGYAKWRAEGQGIPLPEYNMPATHPDTGRPIYTFAGDRTTWT